MRPGRTPTGIWLLLLLAATFACADEAQEDASNRSIELKTRTTIKLERRLGGCAAKLTLQYWQMGSEAEVETTITNAECGPSAGEYRLLVRYRDESGVQHTDEYPETWRRDDAEPIVTTRRYPIGDNVDLVRVLSRGLSCECVTTDPALDTVVQ